MFNHKFIEITIWISIDNNKWMLHNSDYNVEGIAYNTFWKLAKLF